MHRDFSVIFKNPHEVKKSSLPSGFCGHEIFMNTKFNNE